MTPRRTSTPAAAPAGEQLVSRAAESNPDPAPQGTPKPLTAPPDLDAADATARRAITDAQRLQRQVAAIRTGMYVKAPNGLKLRYRKVRRLALKVKTAMPWLDQADEPTIRAWCEIEIVCATVFAELYANGILAGSGEPRRLLSEYRMLRTAQLGYANALGMSPAARMALKVGASKAKALDRGEPADPDEVAALEERLMARMQPEQTREVHDHGGLRHEHFYRRGDGHDHRADADETGHEVQE